MKKTAMFVLAFVFLLGATCAIAKGANGNKDFSRPLKAEKVKLFGKKAISDSEREKGNALEQMIIKGAKTAKPAPPTTDPTAGGVTGDLGVLPDGGQKYAIVIGLSNYPGAYPTTDKTLSDLCVQQVPDNDPSVYAQSDGTYTTLDDEIKANCKDGDSVNMEDALLSKYGFVPSNVVRLSDSIATFSKIEEEVMKLVGWTITHEDGTTTTYESKLTKDDELVFFFSGHGVIGYGDPDGDIWEDEDGGIVVYDSAYDAAKYMDTTTKYPDPDAGPYDNYKVYYDSTGYDPSAYIWDGQLKAWFENAPTKRIFFAFDTCNAAEMDDLEEAVDPTVNGVGRVMAFSSGKNESSYTYYLGGANNSGNIHDGEGLFSHYFVLRAMHDGLADGSNPLRKTSTNPPKKDGKVAVEEAFSYAYPLVRAGSSYRQTPVLEDAFTNDLLLGYQP